jgi:hypothetical protein
MMAQSALIAHFAPKISFLSARKKKVPEAHMII